MLGTILIIVLILMFVARPAQMASQQKLGQLPEWGRWIACAGGPHSSTHGAHLIGAVRPFRDSPQPD